jgi:hypothetical protein
MPTTNINPKKMRRCRSREADHPLRKYAVVTAVGVEEAEEVVVIAVEIDAVAITMAVVATEVIAAAVAMRSAGLEARAVVHRDRSILREIRRKSKMKETRWSNRSLNNRNLNKISRRCSARIQSGLR